MVHGKENLNDGDPKHIDGGPHRADQIKIKKAHQIDANANGKHLKATFHLRPDNIQHCGENPAELTQPVHNIASKLI